MRRHRMTLSRRTLLSAGAATATVLASGRRSAVAESPQLVVGTWGGDYGQLLSELVDKPLVVPQGVEVVQDVANADPRKTKLLVERQSRRGRWTLRAFRTQTPISWRSRALSSRRRPIRSRASTPSIPS